MQTWPKDGPPLAWSYEDLGIGFSGPAVVGNRLYTMGSRKDKKTYVIALDIGGEKPKEAWSKEVGAMYEHPMNFWGNGPRSTPTMDGEYLYALTGFGDLVCLAVKDGKEVWKKDMENDFNGEMMSYWGYSESVLIDGDNLICTPGGKDGTVAALDKKNGAVKWRSKKLTDKATYASIMPAEIHGVRQYIVMTYVDNVKGGAVAGVAAKDGELLWYEPHYSGQSFAACTTPLVKGDEVYITAGYQKGCKLLKLTKQGQKFLVEDIYKSKMRKNMKNAHGGVVRIGEHIYGHNEKQGFVCQDWKTGDQTWMNKLKLPSESIAVVAAGDQIYLYSEEGESVLLQASPMRWEEKGRFKNPKESTTQQKLLGQQAAHIWTHPIIANGKLYLRDQEYLFCYDIRDKK